MISRNPPPVIDRRDRKFKYNHSRKVIFDGKISKINFSNDLNFRDLLSIGQAKDSEAKKKDKKNSKGKKELGGLSDSDDKSIVVWGDQFFLKIFHLFSDLTTDL